MDDITKKKKRAPRPYRGLAIVMGFMLVVSFAGGALFYSSDEIADIFIPADCVHSLDFYSDNDPSLQVKHNLFGEIRIVITDSVSNSPCTLARFDDETNYVVSPDGAYLAFTQPFSQDSTSFQHLFIVSLADNTYTRFPEIQFAHLQWSPDGSYLLAETTQISRRIPLHEMSDVILTLLTPTDILWRVNVNVITPTTRATASWDGDTVIYDYENPDIADCRISLAGEVEGCGNMP
ncbi:MAG: hypothetical protein AAFR81_01620 [Chloroflexota bacterium]